MLICPTCQSSDVNKNGYQSKKQRYRCKACSRTFVPGAILGRPANNEPKTYSVKVTLTNTYLIDVEAKTRDKALLAALKIINNLPDELLAKYLKGSEAKGSINQD